jgi:cytochrome c nitrite reductase small subunit
LTKDIFFSDNSFTFQLKGVDVKNSRILVISSLMVFAIAVGFFVYLVNESKALSYLSDNPKACINCHVMNTQYSTWQHSSHKDVTCIQCHLPTDDMVNKYLAKAKDGWNHSVAFTLNTYSNAIKISDDGVKRVQKNCISCHSSIVSNLMQNADKNHNFADDDIDGGRRCWDCHKSVPHGKVRGLSTTLDSLGFKEK